MKNRSTARKVRSQKRAKEQGKKMTPHSKVFHQRSPLLLNRINKKFKRAIMEGITRVITINLFRIKRRKHLYQMMDQNIINLNALRYLSTLSLKTPLESTKIKKDPQINQRFTYRVNSQLLMRRCNNKISNKKV